jgi:hypothetical protein
MNTDGQFQWVFVNFQAVLILLHQLFTIVCIICHWMRNLETRDFSQLVRRWSMEDPVERRAELDQQNALFIAHWARIRRLSKTFLFVFGWKAFLKGNG